MLTKITLALLISTLVFGIGFIATVVVGVVLYPEAEGPTQTIAAILIGWCSITIPVAILSLIWDYTKRN